MQKNQAGLLSPYIKINSKWIIKLSKVSVRPETIELLEANVGSTLFCTGLSKVFWMSP